MANSMKSNNAAIAAMQQMLQERILAEPALAIKLANPKKSLESAINYLCHEIQKSGMCVVDDQTVLSILLHFYDEDSIENGGTPINCNIVVSKPELSDEDKEALKEQAMKQYQEEQLRELRSQSKPKAQPKTTATAPKAGAEVDTIPNLFDEL